MNFSYPISLNLTDKKCCVIGGGKVAERKALSLLSAGAVVKVVSPILTDELEKLVCKNKFSWVKDDYAPEFIGNSFLVIAATNNKQINTQIAEYCRTNNILVNVVDSPAESTFIVNAAVKQGDLLVAISTNGKSPALAKKIKEELGQLYGFEYAIFLKLLAEARDLAKITIKDEKLRRKFLQQIVEEDILELIRLGYTEEARERVIACLLSY